MSSLTLEPESVESKAETVSEKRRLLLLVRTGLTLAIGYLLIFSTGPKMLPMSQLVFILLYLGSNVFIAVAPARMLSRAPFDIALVLFDTAAMSLALFLIPEANTDVFVFYFVIVLLASISDRLSMSVIAPIVTSFAYLAFLLARYGTAEVMRPEILLRLPFFLLAGAFYGFFVDRVRRGQVAAAAAAERAQARTEFLYLITHDLKQPLWSAEHSATQLYERMNNGSGESRALAAQVIVNLRRMEALTLNFLQLSRIESRGLTVTPQTADLNIIIEDLVDSFRPAAHLKQIEMRVELDLNVPAVMLDAPQLQRALANLIDNAVKFTPEKGGITIRTAATANAISVTIGDSGPGIAAEQAEHLFSRFANGRYIPGRCSTGLGLYITHAIIAAHGGQIAYETGRAGGAWFRVRLPVQECRAHAPTAATRKPMAVAALPSVAT